ncbi:DUF5970 family protein [Bacillus sp. A015]
MKSKYYLFGLPILMGFGIILSMSNDFLFPVLTFGAVGLYLFIFTPIRNRWIKYFFLFIFILNLLASIGLYLEK